MDNDVLGLAIESWTLYVFGLCLIVSRIVFRLIKLRSLSKLQTDDWFMIAITIPFTGTVVCANQVLIYQHSPTHDLEDMIWASKMKLALEECQITTTWLVKACLLVLYWRIFPVTTSRTERRYIAWISAYCLFSYLTIQVLLPFWCQPMRNYWNPSSEDAQCSTYRNHSIATLALDLTATLAVLLVPVPFIPTPRKFLLAFLLFFGFVTLVIGVLGRYYVISQPASLTYLNWYTAQTAVIILFANLPFLSSLVTKTSASRHRCMSNNLALSQWPVSYKDTPPLRAQRLDSTATTVSTMSSSMDTTEGWNSASVPSLTPPTTPVLKLRTADSPPQMEMCWWTRRPSMRDADAVNLLDIEPGCPLR
ncbi:hypothetical protein K504DRAFT_392309 [Pleomassaria siparia CBS 279.74]|uniref:Rhodopsin domain-containing protein n=1 Tax=Pleomassaria siparia CBS 279.74 TaxID=1314801 RepID=A0A6G1JSI0_9PLEO|nr:hypothetical protein K504DRAFT_392309 [Pleomassaria siparia CBS 279.74]